MHYYDLIYLVVGAVTGLLSGLLGIGGGIIIIPGLLLIFFLDKFPHALLMHCAAGTSLAIMIFTAISSVLAHHAKGNVVWPLFWRILPGALIGVVIGVISASFLSTTILEKIFSLFLLFIAIKMLILSQPKPSRQVPGGLSLSGVSLFIGFKSGLLGIGGGAITIPFLTYCNTPMRKASGTSISCTLPMAILGTIGFIITGWHVTTNMSGFIGYVYWPAVVMTAIASVVCTPTGVKTGSHLNTNLLKRIFAIFLLVTGIKLLF